MKEYTAVNFKECQAFEQVVEVIPLGPGKMSRVRMGRERVWGSGLVAVILRGLDKGGGSADKIAWLCLNWEEWRRLQGSSNSHDLAN